MDEVGKVSRGELALLILAVSCVLGVLAFYLFWNDVWTMVWTSAR